MTKPEEKTVGCAFCSYEGPAFPAECPKCGQDDGSEERKAREHGQTKAGKDCEAELERRAFARYSFAETWHEDP